MEYLSISQTAEKWGLSKRRVQVLCSENRIPGVMRVGSYWAIPAEVDRISKFRSSFHLKQKDIDYINEKGCGRPVDDPA